MKIQIKKILFLSTCIYALNYNHDIVGKTPAAPAPLKQRRLGSNNYGTHIFALLAAVLNTTGPILEMGCGNFSTPLLHAVCSVNKRFLLSVEADTEWLKLFTNFVTDWHQFKLVPVISKKECQAWDNVGNEKHWSVVLIDHTPVVRRGIDIMRLRQNTDIFVIHDSQNPKPYGYDKIYPPFKYSYTYDVFFPTTTLLSDVIDVAAFFRE